MAKILFTTPDGVIKKTYFSPAMLARLGTLGEVIWNPYGRELNSDELGQLLGDVAICLTHWSVPTFTAKVLDQAPQLRLIAHAAGTVADLATPAVFERGIKVSTANRIMARYTAEGLLSCVLTGLRRLPQQMQLVKTKGWHNQEPNLKSLFEARVGLVGLGAIGRWLLQLIAPFNPEIRVYDPYLDPARLPESPKVTPCELDELLEWAEIITIQAALTPETANLFNRERLKKIRNGALLVNTARGAIIDEDALAEELATGRFSAVLDVYRREPLLLESPLRGLDNVLLLPHSAASSIRLVEMADAMCDEIERFLNDEPLQYQVSYEEFQHMTQERPFDIYGR